MAGDEGSRAPPPRSPAGLRKLLGGFLGLLLRLAENLMRELPFPSQFCSPQSRRSSLLKEDGQRRAKTESHANWAEKDAVCHGHGVLFPPLRAPSE